MHESRDCTIWEDPPNSPEYVQGYPHSWRYYDLFPILSDRAYGSPLDILHIYALQTSHLHLPDPHLKKEALVKCWLPTTLPRNERSPPVRGSLHCAYHTVGGCSLPNKAHGRLGIAPCSVHSQKSPRLLPYAYARLVTFHRIAYGHFLRISAWV